jgi:hypothetical protein
VAKRLVELRCALLAALSHDALARDSAAEADEEGGTGTVDFRTLRGFNLRRWAPSPHVHGSEDLPAGWDAANAGGEAAALKLMRTEIEASDTTLDAAAATPLAQHFREAAAPGAPRVPVGTGLDRALASLAAHARAEEHQALQSEHAAAEGAGGRESRVVVPYKASDAQSVDRVVALAHAAVAREAAARAAREHGLLGTMRSVQPRGVGEEDGGADK